MFFDVTLYLALVVFGIGMLIRLVSWFRRDVGIGEKGIPASARLAAAVKGFLGVVFSGRIFGIVKAFVVDVLLQLRILRDREDRMLWVMHILIFAGFTLLLLMHALGSVLTKALFPDYQSTLNPFLFLRNVFGVLVFIGLVLAVVRRASLRKERVKTTGMDYTVIALFVIIMVSGFLLEATKISSYSIYQQMVEEYATVANPAERKALEVYWVKNFGVVSPGVKEPFSQEILAKGKEAHEVSCASCHSEPQVAFISYPLSRALKSAALSMDQAGLPKALWIIHFLACFVGLAYLPFSKMFHIIATPVSLLVASAGGEKQDPAALATLKVIELDGCSHGGTCRLECPIRQKREERISLTNPFGPEVDFIGEKSFQELGCRSFQG
jgi:nitrate reductase gamma subunit